MNRWCVPDFEVEEDHHLIPSSSGLHRPPNNKPSKHGGDELVELLWENGQLVNQNHKSLRKKTHHYSNSKYPYQSPQDDFGAASISGRREFQDMGSRLMEETGEGAAATGSQHLFMEEDEMASWLHYPLSPDDNSAFRPRFADDNNNNNNHSNLVYPAQFGGDYTPPQPPPQPPVNRITQIIDDRPTEHKLPAPTPPEHKFSAATPPTPPEHKFSAATPAPAPHRPPIPTPMSSSSSSKFHNFGHFSRHKVLQSDESQPTTSDKMRTGSAVLGSSCETPPMWASKSSDTAVPEKDEAAVASEQMTTRTSSSAGSGAGAEPSTKMPTEDRKRKARETDEQEYQSEDDKFESVDTKKQARGSTSARRARAAEVHNLSERRRRDRINEKMKALQELIPRCNKSDKASMLDEAIEYLKSLQLQVQMMSMGCGMVPMMFPPGVQQYMSPMGMGMGMGMGMDFGLNRPMMMPYASVLAPRPAHLGQTPPVPGFHVPPPPANTNNSPRPPIFPADPYQNYFNSLHMQVPRHPDQNESMVQPCPSKGAEGDNNHKPG
ncbi:hypothetical protein C5167_032811 [Papaver somniferum]|uniref:BHLH domain-containing protein n=1 Tax=Papaver somniferum TaxID=3469 RepID=A0A4Y7KA63_PAPSO|nr:transcription factor PIF1-like [Papaver somniferum]RZC68819.1 hypothetical protein C5167_032811 [Papaver somniferum]